MADEFYGNEYAQQTMNRAAYGDVAAGMMMGARTLGGGAMYGAQNMFSDIGGRVLPTYYTPPARVQTGFYGQYVQETGFIRGALAAAGLVVVPRGTTALEYGYHAAGDFGERLGSGTAAATAAAGGLALGSVLSPLGGLAGRAAGGLVGTAFGGGMLGAGMVGIGGLMGSFMAPLAGLAMGDAVIGAVNQRRELQESLAATSFRFIGAGSAMADPRLGAGMGRAARQDITDFIRKMDIADPTMSTQDLGAVLSRGSELGLFTGTTNIGDFKKKFKDITESVKTVVNTLHTTLEEGLRVMKELRGVGIDPSQVKSVVGMADMTGRMAGRTGMEMLGLGLQGAEMFRGTGITMGIGMQANMMNVAAIRAARDAGTLAQETIAQAGGEEALAQRMTAGGLAFTQSTMGRGMGAAFATAAGGLNMNAFMGAMGAGGGDFVSMFQRAAANMGSPAALRNYQANQEKFFSEMGKTFGGRGQQMFEMSAAMSQAAYFAPILGVSTETEFVNALKEQGKSRAEIDTMLAQIRGRQSIFDTAQASVQRSREKQTLEEASQNFVLYRFGHKVEDMWTGAKDVVARPLDRMINRAGEIAQELHDQYVTGATRVNLGDVDLSTVTAKRRTSLAGVDLSRGAFSTQAAGDAFREAYESGALRGLGITIGRKGTIAGGIGVGRIGVEADPRSRPLNTFIAGGRAREVIEGEISQDDLELISSRMPVLTMRKEDAQRIARKEDIESVSHKISAAVMSGAITSAADLAKMASVAFGYKEDTALGRIKAEEMAALRVAVQGTTLEQNLSDQQKKMVRANVLDDANVQAMKASKAKYDAARGAIEGAAGKLGYGVAERLAQAAQPTLSQEKRQKITEEALELQMKASGQKPEDARRTILAAQDFLTKHGDVGSSLIESASNAKSFQEALGSNALADAVASTITSSAFDNRSADRRSAEEVATKIREGQILGLSEKEISVFRGTDVFGVLKKGQKDIESLRALRAGGDERKVRDIIEGYTGAGKGDRLMGLYQKDFSEFTRALSGEMAGRVQGTQALSAAGGALAGPMGEQQNALEAAATQTRINLSVLQAMDALAKRLGK